MNYAYFAIACGITLPCTVFAAMQPAALKNQKQGSLRQTAMPILEELLPKVLAAMVRDYLPRDYSTYQHYKTIETEKEIITYRLNHDNKKVLLHHRGTIDDWEIATTKRLSATPYNSPYCSYVCLHPHNSTFLAINEDGALRLYDFERQTGRILHPTQQDFYEAIFNNDGSRILACYSKAPSIINYIDLFDSSTEELIAEKQISGPCKGIIASRGTHLLFGYIANKAGYLLTHELKDHTQLIGHEKPINSIDISHDAKYALTASDDRTARIWETESGKQLRSFSNSYSPVIFAQYNPTNTTMLVLYNDQTIYLFNREMEKDPRPQDYFLQTNGLPTFSPDGSSIIVRKAHQLIIFKETYDVPRLTHTSISNAQAPSSIKNKKRRRNNKEEEE